MDTGVLLGSVKTLPVNWVFGVFFFAVGGEAAGVDGGHLWSAHCSLGPGALRMHP